MPRYNVKNEHNEWACFSTIVDDFVTAFMSEEDFNKWRVQEYGIHCGPLENTSKMEYNEAVRRMLCAHGKHNGKNGGIAFGCDDCRFYEVTKAGGNPVCNILEHGDKVIKQLDNE